MPTSLLLLYRRGCRSCDRTSISMAPCNLCLQQDVPLGFGLAPLCKAVQRLHILATRWLSSLQQL